MKQRPIPADSKADAGLCKALEGKLWQIGQDRFRFHETEKVGDDFLVPYPSGVEAFAYRMTNLTTGKVNFLKLFRREFNAKRLRRTEWLLAQQLWNWDEVFLGSPRHWVSTQHFGRPNGIDRDFGGIWLAAVPGSTWNTWKGQLCTGQAQWPFEIRTSLARQLIRALAILERVGIIHGDISDRNVLIDVRDGSAKLFLIDYDGFVLKAPLSSTVLHRLAARIADRIPFVGRLFGSRLRDLSLLEKKYCQLSVEDGGTIGTEYYAPPELMLAFEEGKHNNLFPTTDLHARDILLIELLCCGLNGIDQNAPQEWDDAARQKAAQNLLASSLPFTYLINGQTIQLELALRPTSMELARLLGAELPPIVALQAADSQLPFEPEVAPKNTRSIVRYLRVAASNAAALILIAIIVFHFRIRTPDIPPPYIQPDIPLANISPPEIPQRPDISPPEILQRPDILSPPRQPLKPQPSNTGNLKVEPIVNDKFSVLTNAMPIKGWNYLRTYKQDFLYAYAPTQTRYYKTELCIGLQFTHDGSRLATMRSDGVGSVVDTKANEIVQQLQYGTSSHQWRFLSITRDGSLIVLARNGWSGDPFPRGLIMLDFSTSGVSNEMIKSKTIDAYPFAVSANGNLIAFGESQLSVRLVNRATQSDVSIDFPASVSEFGESKTGNLAFNDDGSFLAIGRYQTAPSKVETYVYETKTLNRVWENIRTPSEDFVYAPRSIFSANAEFLFTYLADENRMQCTHLPTNRTVFSQKLAGPNLTLIERKGSNLPEVVSSPLRTDDEQTPMYRWNPRGKGELQVAELPSNTGAVAISRNGEFLAIFHSRSATISLYQAD